MAHYKGAASEGTRAVNLLKKREQAKEEFAIRRKKIEEVYFQNVFNVILEYVFMWLFYRDMLFLDSNWRKI